jgi:hypothetical protein
VVAGSVVVPLGAVVVVVVEELWLFLDLCDEWVDGVVVVLSVVVVVVDGVDDMSVAGALDIGEPVEGDPVEGEPVDGDWVCAVAGTASIAAAASGIR